MLVHFKSKSRVKGNSTKYCQTNLDMAAKRRKKHKNQISGLIISMGYETEIQEF
jgi:hypothetical protein